MKSIGYILIGLGSSVIFGGFMVNINAPQKFQYIGNNNMIVGFFLCVLGGVIYLIGEKSETVQASPTRIFQGKVCGNCYFFGKKECKSQEKLFNAMPCEDFTP